MEWFNDLCEYYNVSPEEAIQLGIRKTGRRPDLPSSKTCNAVKGLNFEELWQLKPRDTIQQKMDFYKDIGAWLVFRQCNYRSNFDYRGLFFQHLKPNSSIVEYGCGVAPLTNFIIEHFPDISNMKFSLVDVESEPLNFAKWRLNKKVSKNQFDFYTITAKQMIPDFGDKQIDIICIMDVFEHLPNPYDVMVNLNNHSHKDTILIETWVDNKPSGPDLQEARDEKTLQ
ncbi:MAG: methyltransferase domain-containing protein [Clostridia bacterium]|jgi:2-polyprenyl-3-methyl-5-hydroxy-6-metoxy-1,4-benzoquinol methylase